jgi:hypothetical protein
VPSHALTVITVCKHQQRAPHVLVLAIHIMICSCSAKLLETSDLMTDAADALIDDSFFRCFTSAPPDPWNWNWYLFPQWAVGCVLRYCIIFPIRLTLLLIAMALALVFFFTVQAVLRVRTPFIASLDVIPLPSACRSTFTLLLRLNIQYPALRAGSLLSRACCRESKTRLQQVAQLAAAMQDSPRRRRIEREIVRLIACFWIAVAWNGVVKYHGPRPSPAPNRVWVANHSSMIDYTLLTAFMPFAAIMQLHGGWVGFLQRQVLTCLGCLWFQRGEARLPCCSLPLRRSRCFMWPELARPAESVHRATCLWCVAPRLLHHDAHATGLRA